MSQYRQPLYERTNRLTARPLMVYRFCKEAARGLEHETRFGMNGITSIEDAAARLSEAYRVRLIAGEEIQTHDAALLLGVSDATIKRWTIDGRLKCRLSPRGTRFFRLGDLVGWRIDSALPAQQETQSVDA